MSISATTCITYTGSTPLGPTMYLYSDVDGYSTSFGSVPTSSITPPNCPYLITGIPDGATIIRLRDYVSGCCLDIPITSDDLCILCNLNLTDYQSSTVSQIIAGDLDSACGQITDYVIFWYGPDSSTNVGYTSGSGSTFSYQFTHPLTGNAAIFAEAGTYTPVLDKAIINGIPFSQTGGTGYNPAVFDCFPNVVVDPLNCSNGNFPGQTYEHQYAFSNAGAGVTPQPLSATFELSANTNFFPFQFKGVNVYDSLKITYSGSNYPGEEFTLEWVNVGSNAGGFNLTTFPRRASTSGFVTKVLTLTGFTVNNGDTLTLEVTPNSAISQTNWYFDFTCKSTFDCNTCLDNYQNNPYKIVSSSISALAQACDRSNISFDVSGCSSTEILNEDIWKYFAGSPNSSGGIYASSTGLVSLGGQQFYWSNSACTKGGASSSATCPVPNSNVITYEKTYMNLNITCSDYNDFLDFYNEYNSIYASNSGSPFNNTVIGYYRSFAVLVPLISGSTQCGDGTTWRAYDIHYSSVVTTGQTTPLGPWYINYSMPTVSTGITYSTCEVNCGTYETQIVNGINTASTGSSNNINITTNTGAKAITTTTQGYRLQTTNTPYTGSPNYTGYIILSDWSVKTTPWTGASTYVNSFSGQTCPLTNFNYNVSNAQYVKYLYSYNIVLTNPSDPTDFQIYGSPINNYVYSGYPSTVISELALTYSGGSVTYSNPYYVI